MNLNTVIITNMQQNAIGGLKNMKRHVNDAIINSALKSGKLGVLKFFILYINTKIPSQTNNKNIY